MNTNPHSATSPRPLAHPINDAAYLLGVGRTTIYELIKLGKLKKVAIGGRSVITAESIEKLLADAIAEAA